MLLGKPGTGKTTFLRKIGVEAIKGKKGNYKHLCIPVFIELKRVNDTEFNINRDDSK